MTDLGKVSKKMKNTWIYPSRLAGWGQQGVKIHPKKYIVFKNKYEDDQNVLLCPEN